MQVKLTHKPTTDEPASEKLRALVDSWRDKLNKTERPPSADEFLNGLGYSERAPGWVMRLVGERKELALLRDFYQRSAKPTKDALAEELFEAVLDELLHFSRGLADDPLSARFTFSLEATRMEELFEIIGRDGLAEEVEEALCEFDRQVEDRRKRIEARLAWKPEKPQRRVNREVSSRKYEPGQPALLTGRLNDAPEMLGQKLPREKTEEIVLSLERSFYRYKECADLPRNETPEVCTRNTYFAQGLEPRVQFGQAQGAPGVEGYLKNCPEGGPRVLEFPMEDGSFCYLMFDGHHRAAAQMLQGQRSFRNVTVMTMDNVETEWGHKEKDILDAIRDLHTHLYMTEAPVPR